MKKFIALIFTIHLSLMAASAQNECEPFRAYIINKEYQLFLRIDFCNESITIPGQELYGELPGYLGKKHNSFCWVITSAEVKDHTAHLTLINDYGSEDFTATLTQKDDSTYIFQHVEGSSFKMPYDGKWQKMPRRLEFKRSK